MQAATVTKTDVQPSHLLLNDAGVFNECILVSQVTPRTARVLLEETTAIVSCRKLWPWIPGVHAKTVSAGASEAAVMTAAELFYADMCVPRGSLALPAMPSSKPTHMFLNGNNVWTPCALISMISLELCDVCVNDVGRDVPSALMAAFDAALAGKHVAHVASKAKFSRAQAPDTANANMASAATVALNCWSGYRSGHTTLVHSPKQHGSFDLRQLLLSPMLTPRGGKRAAARVPTTTVERAAAPVPNEAQCMSYLRDNQDADWTVPMHPNLSNKRVRQILRGMMQRSEWAQMHHFLDMLNEVELEAGTNRVYSDGVRHFMGFLERYPLEKEAFRGSQTHWCDL